MTDHFVGYLFVNLANLACKDNNTSFTINKQYVMDLYMLYSHIIVKLSTCVGRSYKAIV